MNNRPSYRAAIIGLGFVGAGDQVSGDRLGQQVCNLDGTHAEALSRHPRVALTAGSSRDTGRRERFTGRTGVDAYADWERMLREATPDIVSVAAYTPLHAEMTVRSVECGARVVYCEKPIAECIEDAESMLAACRDAGALLVINHNRRFNPLFRRVRECLDAGALGRLTSANLQWPSGRLGNIGTHVFDALRMLTGQPVAAVSGTLDPAARPDCRGPKFSDPGGWGLLRLRDDTVVTVDAGDYSRAPLHIQLNTEHGRVTMTAGEARIERWDGTSEVWSDLREQTSMDIAVNEIVAWLDGDRPFPYDPAEAVETLHAIVGFHASYRRNSGWVSLPLQGHDRQITISAG